MASIDDRYTAAELSDLDPFVPTGVLMVERDTHKAKWGTGAKYSTQPYWDPEDGDGTSTATAIAASAATLVSRVSTTTAALEAVANAINTTDKYAGKMVWNATTGLPLWADGPLAADTWSLATGVAAHSPV